MVVSEKGMDSQPNKIEGIATDVHKVAANKVASGPLLETFKQAPLNLRAVAKHVFVSQNQFYT